MTPPLLYLNFWYNLAAPEKDTQTHNNWNETYRPTKVFQCLDFEIFFPLVFFIKFLCVKKLEMD